MSDIDTELLPDFLTGTREHLDEIEAMLIQLVGNPESEAIVHDLFKPIHTIKGSAQFIGLERIASLAHHMEELLDQLRQRNLPVTPTVMDTLMDGRDLISLLVSELEQSQLEISSVDDLIAKLIAILMTDAREDETPADEEIDQELFQVFLDNLQHRVSEISDRASKCRSGDNPLEQLSGCSVALDNLISSANYMGYTELVEELCAWKSEVENKSVQLQEGNASSYDFIDSRCTWITGMFPQIAQANETTEQSTDAENVQTGAAIADDSDSGTAAKDVSAIPVDDASAEIMAAFADDSSADMMAELANDGGRGEARQESPGIESTGDTAGEDTSGEQTEYDIEYELLGDFVTEAAEHLEEIEALLLAISNDMTNIDILNDVFRPIHTIKGGAQFIGLTRIATLSHRMEDLLDLMRRGESVCTAEIVDTLIDGRDRIVALCRELETSQREESKVDDLVERLTGMIDGDNEPAASDTGASASSGIGPASNKQQTATSMKLEQDDYYEEESDQELFGIFLDQLRDKTNSITEKIIELQMASNPADLLAQCRQDIEELKSSSNYMGYEKLNDFYQNWLQEIDYATDAAREGKNISIDFMADCLEELNSVFPQKEQNTTGIDQVMPDADNNKPAEISEIDIEVAEEDALFDKLSSALDDAMEPATETDHVETLHDVFEQMLSGKPVDTRGAIDAVKKDILSGKDLQEEAPAEKSPDPVLPERRQDDRRGDKPDRREDERRSGERGYKKSIRVDADKIDALMNQVGELVVDRSFFFQLFNEMRELQSFLKESAGLDQRNIKQVRAFTYRLGEAITGFGRTTNELQEGVMKVRMLPISQLFNRYPRLLRDLTHNTDKKVRLDVNGEDTELDKMVVEELADPLIHIIRNAVDHGLETAQQRKQAGKDETGTLLLEAFQEGNHIVIDVTDDGRGIDPEKVKAKAVSNGLYTQEQLDQMPEEEVIKLIMSAGFSTAEKITGTSGRGVGMDVVKTNVEKLNGTLEIESTLGVGTRMRLKIPLTLAIIPALMIRVGENLFTIPLANVEETLHINLSDTTTIEGTEVIHLRGQTLPIFHLHELFNVKSTGSNDNKAFVVVVNTGGQQIGFAVDELMGQEEVVIKPLVDYLQEKSGFSGATIIGDGRISLILDIYALVKMTAQRQVSRQKQLSARRRAVGSGIAVESAAHL
ncbi:MAG: Hpt domain-containing protein [Gammaproteobacteria bacterium]|nr:Hpt domain-containing protein [Gammaproteobacteria bacterium]